MSAGLRIYYTLVFIVSAIPEDMETLTLFRIGSLQLYAIDIVHLLIAIAVLKFVSRWKELSLGSESRVYVVFLAWLAVEVLLGFMRFQFRAIGESRYILPFFAFVVPFLLVSDSDPQKQDKAARLLTNTILIAGLAGVVMFVIEVLNGGRFFFTEANRQTLGGFEDFRGARILGSTHAFNIMALAALLFFKSDIASDLRQKNLLGAIALLSMALISRNRAAIIAVVAAILVLMLFQRRIKKIVALSLLVAFVLVGLGFFFPAITDQIVTSILAALNPAADQTGSWRLALNLSALDQALETPWLGQGYGGYFYFLIPGARPEEAPPHNQFIILFLKTGIVGLAISLWYLAGVIRRFSKICRFDMLAGEHKLVVNMVVILMLAQLPYGMAYNFIPLFGVYAGVGALYASTFPGGKEEHAENVQA